MRLTAWTLLAIVALSLCVAAFTGCGGDRWRPGIAPVAGLAMEHVLEVRVKSMVKVTEDLPPVLQRSGSGSCIVVDHRGYLLTCYHVVHGSEELTVDVDALHMGMRAIVVATDEHLDLALIKVEIATNDVVTWGNSQSLMAGDEVFAVGFPFDICKMVRRGIISQPCFVAEFPILLTDAAINPGDSGGGLFDADGDLVGVNDCLYSPCGANVGIAGCIPGNTAHLFVIRNLPSE